jgi:hypothetical protein
MAKSKGKKRSVGKYGLQPKPHSLLSKAILAKKRRYVSHDSSRKHFPSMVPGNEAEAANAPRIAGAARAA